MINQYTISSPQINNSTISLLSSYTTNPITSISITFYSNNNTEICSSTISSYSLCSLASNSTSLTFINNFSSSCQNISQISYAVISIQVNGNTYQLAQFTIQDPTSFLSYTQYQIVINSSFQFVSSCYPSSIQLDDIYINSSLPQQYMNKKLYLDISTNSLYVLNNQIWVLIEQYQSSMYNSLYVGQTQPQSQNYILWFNTSNNSLYINEDGNWIQVQNLSNQSNYQIVDGKTIVFNQYNQLQIADHSITDQQLAYNIDASTIGFNAYSVDGYIVNDNSDPSTSVELWTNKKVTKDALIKSIIFG